MALRELTQRVAEAQISVDPRKLEKLADDPSLTVRKKIAQNPNTPAHTLRKLATDSSILVRKFVAAHEHTDESTFLILSEDVEEKIRKTIVTNPQATFNVLTVLSHDPSQNVREYLAANTSNPDILSICSQDNDSEVRIKVAENKSTPAAVFKSMVVNETDINVLKSIASHTPVMLEQLLSHSDKQVRLNLLNNNTTGIEYQICFLLDSEVEIRERAVTAWIGILLPNVFLWSGKMPQELDPKLISTVAKVNIKHRVQVIQEILVQEMAGHHINADTLTEILPEIEEGKLPYEIGITLCAET